MEALNAVLQWMGLGLCHQLPERSLFGGGLQAPVCARDTGIYVGFVVAFGLISLMHRGSRPTGFAPAHAWVAFGAFLLWMGFDGVSSYAGLRATTNDLRILTGLGVGFSAAAVVVPMINDQLWRRAGRGRVLEPVWRFATWLAAIPLTWLALRSAGTIIGVGLPVVIAVGIFVTLTTINLVIATMISRFDRAAEIWRDTVPVVAVAALLTVVEIALASALRTALLSVTGPLGL